MSDHVPIFGVMGRQALQSFIHFARPIDNNLLHHFFVWRRIGGRGVGSFGWWRRIGSFGWRIGRSGVGRCRMMMMMMIGRRRHVMRRTIMCLLMWWWLLLRRRRIMTMRPTMTMIRIGSSERWRDSVLSTAAGARAGATTAGAAARNGVWIGMSAVPLLPYVIVVIR